MAATCKHLMSFGNRILWFIWKKIMRHEDRQQIICIKKKWKDLITDPFSRAISKTEDIKDRIKNKTKKKKEKTSHWFKNKDLLWLFKQNFMSSILSI